MPWLIFLSLGDAHVLTNNYPEKFTVQNSHTVADPGHYFEPTGSYFSSRCEICVTEIRQNSSGNRLGRGVRPAANTRKYHNELPSSASNNKVARKEFDQPVASAVLFHFRGNRLGRHCAFTHDRSGHPGANRRLSRQEYR